MEHGLGENVEQKRSVWLICANSFFGPILLSLFISNILFNSEPMFINWQYYVPLLFLIIFLTFISLYCQFYENSFYVAVIIRTLALSSIFSFGLHLAWSNRNDGYLPFHCFGLYLIILSFFHFGEFEATAWLNVEAVTIDSFLLNHSIEYHFAIIVSLVEFACESLLYPQWKFTFHPWITWIGLVICLFGDGLRKLAMYTAGQNFNHVIQTDYQSDHSLITSGIYSIVRHPSYVGWFYWSLGTQLILHNPMSLVGYAIVSWRFFKQRIQFEEITLINFFGPKYLIYKRQVPSGLPWIEGY